jgi:hypothetical protein
LDLILTGIPRTFLRTSSVNPAAIEHPGRFLNPPERGQCRRWQKDGALFETLVAAVPADLLKVTEEEVVLLEAVRVGGAGAIDGEVRVHAR